MGHLDQSHVTRVPPARRYSCLGLCCVAHCGCVPVQFVQTLGRHGQNLRLLVTGVCISRIFTHSSHLIVTCHCSGERYICYRLERHNGQGKSTSRCPKQTHLHQSLLSLPSRCLSRDRFLAECTQQPGQRRRPQPRTRSKQRSDGPTLDRIGTRTSQAGGGRPAQGPAKHVPEPPRRHARRLPQVADPPAPRDEAHRLPLLRRAARPGRVLRRRGGKREQGPAQAVGRRPRRPVPRVRQRQALPGRRAPEETGTKEPAGQGGCRCGRVRGHENTKLQH